MCDPRRVDGAGAPTNPWVRSTGDRDLSPPDRRLVEWVAQAKVGDPFPEPWYYASDPSTSILRTLIGLGVVERPAPDADLGALARDAGAAARAWLERNPPPR